MSTIYDVVTVLIFVGVVVLFLHFSQKGDQQIAPYILPGIGCAVANFLGNEGYDIPAWALIIVTAGYVYASIYKKGGVPDEDVGDGR